MVKNFVYFEKAVVIRSASLNIQKVVSCQEVDTFVLRDCHHKEQFHFTDINWLTFAAKCVILTVNELYIYYLH
jgi:hypothetical protein